MIGTPDLTGALLAQRAGLARVTGSLERAMGSARGDDGLDWRGPARRAFDDALDDLRRVTAAALSSVEIARDRTSDAIAGSAGV